MRPDREILWNIGDPLRLIMLGLVAYTLVFIIIRVHERVTLWRLGKPMPEEATLWQRLRVFVPLVTAELATQRRFFRDPYAGLMHFSLFWGLIILFIATSAVFLEEVLGFADVHIPPNNYFLYSSLIWDLGGLLALTGVLMAIFRRSFLGKPHSLSTMDDRIILFILLFQIVSGFALEGLRQLGPSVFGVEYFDHPDWSRWSPGGFAFASLFALFSPSHGAVELSHFVLWWVHALVNAVIPVYAVMRFSKFVHIFLGPVSLFFRNLRPRGTLYPIPNIEEVESFGATRLQDFSWKQLMEVDACTRCARCTDSCPANITGKILSPMMVVQKVKRYMDDYGSRVVASGGDSTRIPLDVIQVPAGEVVSEEELWDCVTCGACMEACPVFIEHVPMIVEMRRSLVMEQGKLPRTAEVALRSIETRGNPGFGTTYGRLDWAQNMDVPIVSEVGGENVDILFWVGCAGSLEDRSMRVARAVATILKKAGVNFAILGTEESCTGDPARRLGNEYLFQLQAQQNIQVLNNHKIKKILTMCPHCFNSLRNEYPMLGGDYEVVHHSQYLKELLDQGSLRLNEDREGALGTVTYHDPCYLGRHNGIMDEPRDVVTAVVGDNNLVEMEQHRRRAMCCGAGGGHYWFEETEGTERIPVRRTSHAVATGANTIGTACPFCTQMFELGLRVHGKEEEIQVLDIAEMVSQRLAEVPAIPGGAD